MAPRVKTSERIVQTSLELFNQQGERSISTNHIAAHMEISPGNLYYHFPNKQAIIAVLFSEYESLVDSFLRPPQGRASTVEDKRFYLQELLAAMWRYRFLHRDLEHLLDSDPELAARYRRFSQRCRLGQRMTPGHTLDHRPAQITFKIGEARPGDMPFGIAALAIVRVIEGKTTIKNHQPRLVLFQVQCLRADQLRNGHNGLL